MKWVERYFVNSHSSNKVYTVSLADDDVTWGCSCPHWTRNVPRPLCKHIREVQGNLVDGNLIGAPNIQRDDFFTEEEFVI